MSTPKTWHPFARRICAVIWPKKPQADDAHEFPEPGVGLPDALHGDRSERGKCRGVQPDCFGHFDDQVLRHGNDASMRGIASATARHAVTGLEPSLRIERGEDRARGAVAQFLEGLELGAHSLQGFGESILAEAVQHLPHEIWPLPGLAQKRCLGGGNCGPSRSRR